MAENYIATYYTWVTGDIITATRINGNNSNIIDGLSGGLKAVNLGKILISGTEVLNSSRELTVTKITIGSWTIQEDGSNLSFQDSGVEKFVIEP